MINKYLSLGRLFLSDARCTESQPWQSSKQKTGTVFQMFSTRTHSTNTRTTEVSLKLCNNTAWYDYWITFHPKKGSRGSIPSFQPISMCPKYAGQGVYPGVHVTPPPPLWSWSCLRPCHSVFLNITGSCGSPSLYRKLAANKLPMREDQMKITEP